MFHLINDLAAMEDGLLKYILLYPLAFIVFIITKIWWFVGLISDSLVYTIFGYGDFAQLILIPCRFSILCVLGLTIKFLLDGHVFESKATAKGAKYKLIDDDLKEIFKPFASHFYCNTFFTRHYDAKPTAGGNGWIDMLILSKKGLFVVSEYVSEYTNVKYVKCNKDENNFIVYTEGQDESDIGIRRQNPFTKNLEWFKNAIGKELDMGSYPVFSVFACPHNFRLKAGEYTYFDTDGSCIYIPGSGRFWIQTGASGVKEQTAAFLSQLPDVISDADFAKIEKTLNNLEHCKNPYSAEGDSKRYN